MRDGLLAYEHRLRERARAAFDRETLLYVLLAPHLDPKTSKLRPPTVPALLREPDPENSVDDPVDGHERHDA